MKDLSDQNPTGRFSGLADSYARFRPGYPPEAIDWIMAHCRLGAGSVLVDVGCGTGISSRLFAARGLSVVGIEPNAEMREKAEAQVALAPCSPVYRDGKAERTGLGYGCADAVLAAQAFHWFQAAAALAEFHRILKAEGWLILLWNERDENDPFTAAYGTVIRTAPETAQVEAPRQRGGEPLLTSPLFQDALRCSFRNAQLVDEKGLLGRAFSASYAPRAPEQAEAFAAALREVFARFQRDGRVALHYETSVYVGRRKAAQSGQELPIY